MTGNGLKWTLMRAFAVPSLLVGCSGLDAGSNSQTESSNAIEGYKLYKFGMSLDEALTAGAGAGFNSWSLSECRKYMPTLGCRLDPDRETYTYPMIEGMEFAPSLEFNKYGMLTDIGQEFRQDIGVTSEECFGLFERTLDRLVNENGPIALPISKEKPSEGWVNEVRTSPAGNKYLVGIEKIDQNFITTHMRSHADQKDASHVLLFAHYIGKECSIRITYKDSLKVERLDLQKLINASQ